MIKFLFNGILRDKSRSLLPVIVVSLGVFLTVLGSGWIAGIFSDIIDTNANFSTGHVKITTKAYAENEGQTPNDLALIGVEELRANLQKDFPDMEWVNRIQFGGLLDVPDQNGETRAQGPAVGKAIDLLSPGTKEIDRMNIRNSIVKGSVPSKQGEALISNEFADRFNVAIGDEITLFSSTMNNSMSFTNFVVCGTVKFGMTLLDRGAIIIDITDAQTALDMEDATSEMLGYIKESNYDNEIAQAITNTFNLKYNIPNDEFSPIMMILKDQNDLKEYLDIADSMSAIMVFIFIIAMSVVLWNTGLLGGLRRYNEYGIRLALGEEKSHIYKTMIYEAILIGIIGTLIGTVFGLAFAYYLQENGLDFSSVLKEATMMFPSKFRALVKPQLFYIGFFPGLIATVLGNALAGVGIYKRKTAQLFKELEV